MRKTKKTAQEIFVSAAPEAAGFLAEMMRSEEASATQRLACAESILSRALGKAGASAAGSAEQVEVLLSDEARECAQ
ncbi:MAG: hypothetical protein RSF90_05750 [Pygmaiobacter sp.]